MKRKEIEGQFNLVWKEIASIAKTIESISDDLAAKEPEPVPGPEQEALHPEFQEGDYVRLDFSDHIHLITDIKQLDDNLIFGIRDLVNGRTANLFDKKKQQIRHLKPEEWTVTVNGVKIRLYMDDDGDIRLKAITNKLKPWKAEAIWRGDSVTLKEFDKGYESAYYVKWEQLLLKSFFNTVPIMPYRLSGGDYKYPDEV